MAITIENGISMGPGITITGGPGPIIDLDIIATYLRNYLNVFSNLGGLINANFYDYDLDGNEYYIEDGGDDMFDGGNYTGPALITNTTYFDVTDMPIPPALPYNTTTTATTDTNFKYISLGYGTSPNRRPLTMLGTRTGTGNPIGFQKAGDIGADGSGSISDGILYNGALFNGFTTHAYYRQTFANGDPTICDLYILLGHPSWSTVFGTVENSGIGSKIYQGAQFRAYGAGTQNVLAITSLLSRSDSFSINTGILQTITQNYTYLIGQALGI